MDEETCAALLFHWVDRAMDNSLENACKRMDSLFADRKRHVITYNHYFTENIQKSFNARNEKRMLEALEQFFPIEANQYGVSVRRTGPKDLTGVCSMVSRTRHGYVCEYRASQSSASILQGISWTACPLVILH
jgi:hypothetical protein